LRTDPVLKIACSYVAKLVRTWELVCHSKSASSFCQKRDKKKKKKKQRTSSGLVGWGRGRGRGRGILLVNVVFYLKVGLPAF
jgi:hypothetical protein